MSRPTNTSRRGFTLVELVLAIVVGSLVLIGVAGVFAGARTMERVFGQQYRDTTELHIAQMTIRRTLLSLQILEDQRDNAADSAGVDDSITELYDDRPRIILENDPIYANISSEWIPQRFEVVVSTPPIALNMATKAAAWARISDRDEDSLDFSSEDASGGVLRSVFELRPDGVREREMRRIGIMDPNPQADEKSLLNDALPTGWTLWWRPILRTESTYLRAGGIPLSDAAGTDDEIRFRLAGAIPLITGIDVCTWTIFKSDIKVNEYSALEMSELPAYAEFEMLLTGGQYASWMFEVDWVLGQDPLDILEDEDDPLSGDGSGDGTGNGDGPTNPDDPRRGGGVQVPTRNNSNGNLGGRDQ